MCIRDRYQRRVHGVQVFYFYQINIKRNRKGKMKEDKKEEKKNTSDKKVQKNEKRSLAPVRLYVKGAFVGFRRSKGTQNSNQALVKIQGVNDRKALRYYQGKFFFFFFFLRVVYVYKAHNQVKNTKFRTIWGRIGNAHGSNGIVRARFAHNLPPRAMGSILRVMLYPNRD
eukprot:TRINITY_DN3796_c0_g1_i19.p1 TRINITY_DN3796_c0_g1~~TRINITY_DN3796_c0_g1_i19.p1  ORF type:complete len:170 (-),score=48.58 TRINITY_DN3796_c0_g1_i19:170-679(-)